MRVTVVGAGLAGCEAAWQLAKAGLSVSLVEMKPKKYTPAHHYQGFAELVCSNSLKAFRLGTAGGMMKAEMRLFGSLILEAAEQNAVPAGGALAVDRYAFSDEVTRRIRKHPLIEVEEREVTAVPDGPVIIATGPLTSDSLADAVFDFVGEKRLHFYDAAAPIVTKESISMERAFFAARYGRGGADYINCPMNEEEYERFYQALVSGETALLHSFDKREFYEGCMPIEVMAKRGKDSIRFGPLRPIGLRHPQTGERFYAALQLRREDAQGSLYNLVGFQTNLKFQEQKRIFSMIPGLENAEFVRYGVMHRNTFLDSPHLLDERFCLKKEPRIYFAGQMTGVEGYMESAASGILAGFHLARECLKRPPLVPAPVSMMGALCQYISDPQRENFQPMGANMGLLPPLETPIRNKQERYEALARRGITALERQLEEGR